MCSSEACSCSPSPTTIPAAEPPHRRTQDRRAGGARERIGAEDLGDSPMPLVQLVRRVERHGDRLRRRRQRVRLHQAATHCSNMAGQIDLWVACRTFALRTAARRRRPRAGRGRPPHRSSTRPAGGCCRRPSMVRTPVCYHEVASASRQPSWPASGYPTTCSWRPSTRRRSPLLDAEPDLGRLLRRTGRREAAHCCCAGSPNPTPSPSDPRPLHTHPRAVLRGHHIATKLRSPRMPSTDPIRRPPHYP